MNDFIHPKEVRKGIGVYIGSIVFAFLGLYSLGGLLMAFMATIRIPVKELGRGARFEDYFTSNQVLLLNFIPFFVGFALLLLAARVFHKRSFLSFLSARAAFDWKRFLVAFAWWSFFLTVLFIVEFWTTDPQTLQWNYNPSPFFLLVGLSLILVPIQTGFEEILFRGFFLQLLGTVSSRAIVTVLFNGLAFGALHLMNPEVGKLGWFAIVFYVLSGIFTALITVMDNGLELSWGFHTANNLFGVLIVTNNWQVIQTEALFLDTAKPAGGWDLIATLLVLYPLMLLILAKIYGWKAWKTRLFRPENSNKTL